MMQRILAIGFTLIILGILVYLPAFGQRKQQAGTIDFYILAGQSNMAGRGQVTPEYAGLQPARVVMLDASGQLVQARHPIHFDKPASVGVGPGLQFAGEMLKKAGWRTQIGLIPCAVGGTSISKWEPGAFDAATNTHPLDDALLRIGQAKKLGRIKGIIWLQGESDSSPDRAAGYPEKLVQVIRILREAAGDPNLPFVAGELGRFYPQQANINPLLHQVSQRAGCMAVISSEGLTDKGDQTHFDSPSATELGRRFARAMRQLQKTCKKP